MLTIKCACAQLTGVGMDPFVVEKQTLLMLLLSELFQQKGMPVASTNVTSVTVVSSAFQTAGQHNSTGRSASAASLTPDPAPAMAPCLPNLSPVE